jgi:hypothetical protein
MFGLYVDVLNPRRRETHAKGQRQLWGRAARRQFASGQGLRSRLPAGPPQSSAARLVFGVCCFFLGGLFRVLLSTQRLCLVLLFGLFLVDDLGEELLHFLSHACG